LAQEENGEQTGRERGGSFFLGGSIFNLNYLGSLLGGGSGLTSRVLAEASYETICKSRAKGQSSFRDGCALLRSKDFVLGKNKELNQKLRRER